MTLLSALRVCRNVGIFTLMAVACWGFSLGVEILVHVIAGWL